MDEATVTISLSEYNQLRDNAVINHMLIDKITGYEVQMCDMRQKIFDMDTKILDMDTKILNLENKLKS